MAPFSGGPHQLPAARQPCCGTAVAGSNAACSPQATSTTGPRGLCVYVCVRKRESVVFQQPE
eukprot:1157374-Pelagomonas_calceolata.AAC.7